MLWWRCQAHTQMSIPTLTPKLTNVLTNIEHKTHGTPIHCYRYNTLAGTRSLDYT